MLACKSCCVLYGIKMKESIVQKIGIKAWSAELHTAGSLLHHIVKGKQTELSKNSETVVYLTTPCVAQAT
jgi:hypothetical protein